MAETSTIEWTDATWNPVTGCSVVSPGCTNCYAMRLAGTRLAQHPSRAGLTVATKAGPVWNGEVRLNEQWLAQPLSWRRPRMIFVCAHGDLFHEAVPDEWIDRVFAVMALAPQHTFQVLTKRAERMRRYFEARAEGDPWAEAADEIADLIGLVDHAVVLEPRDMPLPNVWLGVSAEDQHRAAERIPHLLATPAAVRFVSAEPLLGPITLEVIRYTEGDAEILYGALTGEAWVENSSSASAYDCNLPRIDWVIVGGESQAGARPMHPDWARSIRDQCAAAGVPFFFKQWGEWVSVSEVAGAGPHHSFPDGATVRRIGKARAGRRLDGVEHNAMPTPSSRAQRGDPAAVPSVDAAERSAAR